MASEHRWIEPETKTLGSAHGHVMNEKKELVAGTAILIFFAYAGAQIVTGAFVGFVEALRVALNGGNLQDPATLEQLRRTIEPPSIVGGTVVAGIVLVLLARHFAGEDIRNRSADGIAWAPGTAAALAVGLVLGASLGIGSVMVVVLVPPSPDSVGPFVPLATASNEDTTYWVLTILLMTPVLEEFLFRGVMFSGLSRTWGRATGAILSTVFFVSAHLPATGTYWPALIAITLLGMGTLFLRIRTSALGPAVAMHFAYNAVLALATYGIRGLSPDSTA